MIRKYVLRDKLAVPSKERMYNILMCPIVTEKASILAQSNKITLKVDMSATKFEIKTAVETIFEMPVESVNTTIAKPRDRVFKNKKGKRSPYKKAIITIKKGVDMSGLLGVQE